MKMKLSKVLFLLSFAFCLTSVAFGQETTGNIEGTVKDANGAVVPNVTITITSATTAAAGTTTTGVAAGFKRTVSTDNEGFFRALKIPPGTYNVVTTASSGFGEARYENITVAIGKTTQVDVAVSAGTANVTVDVAASDAPAIDTNNNAIQTSIGAQKIELIPKGVDFTSVLKTVPGVRPEGRAGGISVDGASGSENVFVIDGQEVNNFRTGTLNGNNAIPTQFVQEVQVKSSGFDAEFGGATGGVISVVTKGGGNNLRGEFGMQFDTPKFSGDPRPTLVSFPSGTGANFVQPTEYIIPSKSGGLNTFPTANLGGPIFKNRLYFFGSYTPQVFETITTTNFFTNAPAATRTLTTTETFRLKRTFQYAFGRLDASPFDNLRLTGTYTWNPIVDEGALPFGTVSLGGTPPSVDFGPPIGRLTGRELTDKQGGRQNSNNVTFQGVYTPTANMVVSGRFSRGFLNEKLGNYFIPSGIRINCVLGSTPANPIPGACEQGFVSAANSETIRDVSIRTNYEGDITYIVSNFGGRHEFKGGYQRFKIFNDAARGYSTKGRIDFEYGVPIDESGAGPVTPSGPICAPGQTSGCVLGTGILLRVGTLGMASNLNQGFYVQDKYQPFSRLTLNFGVRFEKEDLPSFNGFAPPINFGWTDKIAPRLGFAYDIFGDGKTKVFASFGRFYDRLKFELPRGSFGGEKFYQDFFEILPGEVYTQFTLQNIVGGFTGRSVCPSTGFITSGARSRCQIDNRVATNDPDTTIFEGGAVDPDLKPFRQTEFTVGVERQFARDYVFRTRYTYKNVDSAVEDAGARNANNSEAYIIANPGEGLHRQFLEDSGYDKFIKPQRRYDGVEFVLEKRLANNYYFNLNYTYSRLYGNYSGLASSDENGRTSPGVNRFFDLPYIGFTATGEPDNGRLGTDRPHVFNAYGAYIFDWIGSKTNSTELSAFQTISSGTPQTSQIYMVTNITPTIFTKRGDLGRTPTFSQTDFNVTHRYRFGRDNRFTLVGDLNFLNLFDQATVTGLFTALGRPQATMIGPTFGFPDNGPAYINAFNSGSLLPQINSFLDGTLGCATPGTCINRKDSRYGQPNAFQAPRSVRFGFRFLF
ncbi:MAG: carboxypeptidase regulatory-like domain-containing protein [Pyrinomonadaceae bacterium]